MLELAPWLDDALEALAVDESDCLAVLTARVGPCTGVISLFEGDLSPDEAVLYARTLLELGRDVEAVELLGLIAASAAGGPTERRPQGSQTQGAPRAQ